MKTGAFYDLVDRMTTRQKEFIARLAELHDDIVWDGGSQNTRPLRVSLKDKKGNNLAAINTRSRNHILRFEFRSKDYHGPETVSTEHRDKNRAYDIDGLDNLQDVSEILLKIKRNYSI